MVKDVSQACECIYSSLFEYLAQLHHLKLTLDQQEIITALYMNQQHSNYSKAGVLFYQDVLIFQGGLHTKGHFNTCEHMES